MRHTRTYWTAGLALAALLAAVAALRLNPFDLTLGPAQEAPDPEPPGSAFVAPLPVLADALTHPRDRDRAAEERLVLDALPILRDQAQDGHREYLQKWFGVPLLQYPNDLLTYQTMIWAQRPDVIIETGTYRGGLTLYLSMLLAAANPKGRVITIDVDRKGWDELSKRRDGLQWLKKRVTFIHGSSTAAETLEQVTALIPLSSRVLVLLDSLHSQKHVLDELQIYGPLVTKGSYMVVTDTHLDGTHWVSRKPGPLAAVEIFIAGSDDFEIDRRVDRYFISANISGYLKRVK